MSSLGAHLPFHFRYRYLYRNWWFMWTINTLKQMSIMAYLFKLSDGTVLSVSYLVAFIREYANINLRLLPTLPSQYHYESGAPNMRRKLSRGKAERHLENPQSFLVYFLQLIGSLINKTWQTWFKIYFITHSKKSHIFTEVFLRVMNKTVTIQFRTWTTTNVLK